jgi:hypothetical protein
MYIVSRYGGRGRGIWTSINDGTVVIRDRRNRIDVKVCNGIVMSETTKTRSQCTTLRYGQDLTIKKNNRIVHQEFYDPNTLRGMKKGGLWRRQRDFPLCGTKGTLECFSTSSGACGKEVFAYDNGTCAYVAARWRKKLVTYRPNGKLWMVIKGKTHVCRYPIAGELEKKDGDFDIWRFMDGRNWDLTVYDTDGTTVVTQGHFANRQKEGKWLENSKLRYYISGVKVSRSLYEDDPARWNPHEVLKVPNAQLRCSLLNRLGYDKLLARVQSKVIDTAYDGGQLIEIAAGGGKDSGNGVDKSLRLITVVCPSTQQVYVLRVPPDIDNFEQARQWTFGLRQTSTRDGAHLELVNET